jgi:hypothetical protein
MTDEEQRKELSQLLAKTAKAHHQAYIETDGDHPDWPLWYAEYLLDKLPAVLGQELTISEIVYCLVHLSKEQPAVAPEAWWPDYYASYFLENYPRS